MYKDTTIVGFAGFCKSDIMLYLSRILYLSGEKTAIVDRSNEQELCYSVPARTGYDNMLEYRGVDIYPGCQGTPLSNLPVENYSAIIIDFGVNPEIYEDTNHLKVLYIVTDCNRHHTIPLSAWLKNLTTSPDSVRIIRDIIYGKIRPRYIDSLLQAGQFTNILAKYDFPFNDMEYSTRLSTQYDDIFKFSKIPHDYKCMLVDCLTGFFEKEPKAVLKALKKAQMGG